MVRHHSHAAGQEVRPVRDWGCEAARSCMPNSDLTHEFMHLFVLIEVSRVNNLTGLAQVYLKILDSCSGVGDPASADEFSKQFFLQQ